MNDDYASVMLDKRFESDIAVAKAQLGSLSFDWIPESKGELYARMVLAYAVFEMVTKDSGDDINFRAFLSDALHDCMVREMNTV